MSGRPSSTYRLQLHKNFPFAAASDIVDYLDDLGVGAVYLSPILKAEKGSLHGYNLVDPSTLNPELGTEAAFREWARALASRGIGRVADFVPNHMGIASGENPWWNDVLENGPASLYADFFDIDFHPPKQALANKVLLPILGAQYGEVLEAGELSLVREGGAFLVAYYQRRLPVSPPSIASVLERAAHALGDDKAALDELASIVTALKHLPATYETAPERRRERAREKEIIKRRIETLISSRDACAQAVDAALRDVNGSKDDAGSFDALDVILQEQAYRLAFWRVATEEINYRRFFDVNELAAIRMEEPAVFDAMHGYFLRLVSEGLVTGVRLDHTDGLYDPAAYFEELQRRIAQARGEDGVNRTAYVVAEKILEPGERLPRGWAIDGTTGYDFLALLNGLWIDPRAETALTRTYGEATGEPSRFAEVALDSKRAIMRSSLSAEVNLLAQALERLAQGRRRSRDFTLRSLTTAVVEAIAAFPVYRTYMRADGAHEASDEDHVRRAIALAKRRNPDLNATVFDFLEDMLLLRVRQEITSEQRATQVRFAMRFQQLTGPMMAKGIEDTAFYRYARLIALNEVGGHPAAFGTTLAEFHAANAERLSGWPGTMLATSTHDTKRGEDARARLAVLTEMPEEWASAVQEWAEIGRRYESLVLDEAAPSLNDRYYFYQAAVGALPFGAEQDLPAFTLRLSEHMAKATKEAKRDTRWLNPRVEYDQAVETFVRGMLDDAGFRKSLTELVRGIGPYGASNGLSQTALKLGVPGVADTYQGSEFWTLSLCDPDNRTPVDYDARRRAVAELAGPPTKERARELLGRYEDGHIKLHVVRTLLRMRRALPLLFKDGAYAPLSCKDRPEHVVAFARERDGGRVVIAATRFARTLTKARDPWAVGGVWGDAMLELPSGTYRDALTGETVTSGGSAKLKDVFASLPVAVLVAVPG